MKITIPFLFALLCGSLSAQVSLAPPLHPQFETAADAPLSGGFLYTYASGTSTLLNTYSDSLGQIPNPDPILLDVTGAPSNGSAQVQIWLGNNSYKFCAFSSAMVQQWCSDNVTGYLGLLNQSNTWTFAQTFTQIITSTQTDNQIIVGAPGNQTTLDFPPCTGNCVLHFPNATATMVANQNGQLITPSINGTQVLYTPGTYITLPNQSPVGTGAFELVSLVNSPVQAIQASTGAISGIDGIAVTPSGTTGNAIIQETGICPCLYDGSTSAGDYVQASALSAGQCHDAGGTYPASGQVIGRVLSSNAGSGFYNTLLFGPEVNVGSVHTIFTIANNTQTTALTSTVPLAAVSFPAGSLNTVNKTFRMQAGLQVAAAATETGAAYWGMGNTAALGIYGSIDSASLTSTTLTANSTVTCSVSSTGSGGTITCAPITVASAGTPQVVPYVFTIDLTRTVYVGPACSFTVANGANACTTNAFTVEQLN